MALFVFAVALACCAYTAPTALGADSIYWVSSGDNAIRVGNLSGTGSASNLFTGEASPTAVAIDPSTGKLYWTDDSSGAVRVGNLDGTGTAANLFAGENHPAGVAIDPAAGKIYWADQGSGVIRVGNLSGTGTAANLFTGQTGPLGVAIDPVAGKIYWPSGGSIRVGNLSGTGTPSNLFSESAVGVAIDPAAGKIYWAHGPGAIRVGNLNGTGSPSDLSTGEDGPQGVALDPAAGKIYWANAGTTLGTGAVRIGNLNGTGAASNLFVAENASTFVSVLRSPAGIGAPTVSGTGELGSPLSCSQGSWAANLLGAFLYRAPRSFAYQWQLNGADIAGATQSTYTPAAAGSYTCRVTAANQAGSTSQTSAALIVSGPPAGSPQSAPPPAGLPLPPSEFSPDNAFAFPGVAIRDLVLTFTFDFPGGGTLDALATTHRLGAHGAVLRPGPDRLSVGYVHVVSDGAGLKRLRVPLNRRGRRILAIRGKLPVRLTLVYTPTGGQSSRQARKYTVHPG